MAIGGPMWQKAQAQKGFGLGYGKQMRESFTENRRAQIAALGNKLFATQISAGQGMTQLSFQLAATRMQAQFEAAKQRINSSITAAGLGEKIDLLA